MKANLIKNFQNRIVNGDKAELVLVHYEMIIAEIEDCLTFLQEGQSEKFYQSNERARNLIKELINSLDFNYSISRELFSLYIFVNKKLIESMYCRGERSLKVAKRVLNNLLIGWRKAAESVDTDDVAFANAENVYAGLTYGNGTLNESVIAASSSPRGLKA